MQAIRKGHRLYDVVPASSDWEEQDSWYIGAYMSKRFDKWIISDTLTYRSTDHDSFRRQKTEMPGQALTAGQSQTT
ncbi:MAG: hypothetical protein RQM89_03795 [Acetomicrobium sp.]